MANSQPTGKEQNPAPAPVFDLPGLLELSATMAHEHRVAFAQSFASAVVLALRARSLVSAAPVAPLDLAEQRKAERSRQQSPSCRRLRLRELSVGCIRPCCP